MKVMPFLEVAMVQANLVWESPQQNRKMLTEQLAKMKPSVDLIVFPELFTTGFTMRAAEFAEPMDGKTIQWMQHWAKEKNAALIGSVIIAENNNYYNRCLFVYPSGKVLFYDKKHAFSLAGEDRVYTSGQRKEVMSLKGWKICPLICYDLRFPVWARNVENYDVLIYVANWPVSRITAWNTLLKARAIENMCYTIGVNRVGIDGNDHAYSGHSMAHDFLGKPLLSVSENEVKTYYLTLDKQALEVSKRKLNFLQDKDAFTIL